MKRLLFTIAAVVLGLALVEGVLRVVDVFAGRAMDVRVFMPVPPRESPIDLVEAKKLDRPAGDMRGLENTENDDECRWPVKIRQKDMALSVRLEQTDPVRGILPLQEPKPAARRVFVLGSSVAWGDGVEYPDTFAGRLEGALNADRPVEIFNVSLFGADSGIVLFTAQEVIRCHYPDVLVILLGSEFFQWQYEDKTVRARQWHAAAVRRSTLYRYLTASLRAAIGSLSTRARAGGDPRDQLTPMQQCRADASYPEPFAFDAEAWAADRRNYLAAMAHNMTQIIEKARAAGVDVVLTTIPFRYRMCPTLFTWQPIAAVAPGAEGKRARLAFQEGLAQLDAGESALAYESFHRAAQSSPASPLPWHFLGEAAIRLGRDREADAAFRRAREQTVGNLGAVLSANDSLRDVAEQTDTPLVDLAGAMAGVFDVEWKSDELFRDFCHPDAAGHELIARELKPVVQRILSAR
ncbi:MAG: hypothetical protein P9L99_20845 [Candidatus Lernaella stagnicola]|nr:hypothetical protein [Candidatus Lernaella stagnicola]